MLIDFYGILVFVFCVGDCLVVVGVFDVEFYYDYDYGGVV